MRAPALLGLTGLLWCLTANAAAPATVAEARRLIDDLELDAALKSLEVAEKREGNDRETMQEIFTLQAISYGLLGKEAKTRDAFRRLLMIAPSVTLSTDLPPRVRTPFFEAKDWVSTNGPLTAVPGVELGDGLVRSVKVTVEKDVLRLARAVRFHFKVNSVEQTLEVPLSAGKAQTPVGKSTATWWAEVLNERRGVLIDVASAEKPREEWTGVAPSAVSTAPVNVEAAPFAERNGWRRPTGIALAGAGAVGAIVGVVFGAQASSARASVTNAPRDELGRVTTLTQREAAALESTARSQATVANVLFGVGGALAAGGVVLIILGPSSEPVVALSPTPGGVLVTGSF